MCPFLSFVFFETLGSYVFFFYFREIAFVFIQQKYNINEYKSKTLTDTTMRREKSPTKGKYNIHGLICLYFFMITGVNSL